MTEEEQTETPDEKPAAAPVAEAAKPAKKENEPAKPGGPSTAVVEAKYCWPVQVFLKVALDTGAGTSVHHVALVINALGYTMLAQGKGDDAIALFKLNVEAYPDSWNVYDSLAEAYLSAGQEQRARQYYQQSLALNPDNNNAIRILEELDGQ